MHDAGARYSNSMTELYPKIAEVWFSTKAAYSYIVLSNLQIDQVLLPKYLYILSQQIIGNCLSICALSEATKNRQI